MTRSIIKVEGKEISVTTVNGDDFINLTDMVKGLKEGRTVIGNWMSNKDTIEFLGVWERMHNPLFKLMEFHEYKNQAGSGRFTMSPQRWVTSTGAVGVTSKSGRYGDLKARRQLCTIVSTTDYYHAESITTNSSGFSSERRAIDAPLPRYHRCYAR